MKNKIFDSILNVFRNSATLKQTKKQIEGTEKSPDTEEFERCIMCGRLTGIPVSMPIDWRENYEIGLGQVCTECAKNEREIL